MSAEQWWAVGQQCPGAAVQDCVLECAQNDVVVATCVCAGRHSRIRYLGMHSHMYSHLSFFFP